MRRRIVVLALIASAALAGVAVATVADGVTAETVRGVLVEPIDVNTHFENGSKVKIKTKGPIEFVAQRIVAVPGATFGWHSHSGENVNVVKEGTLTLYHADACTVGIPYGPGDAFTTSPDQIHLARNNGTTTVVFFATYFQPPGAPVRIDQPSPGPGCPQ